MTKKIPPPCLSSLLGVQQDPHLLDGQARFEAINPFESYIVQAPAGSGKTALLTQRFLALLSQVTQPENIVAMTFTKKAAAEMRDRIMSALNTGRLPSLPSDASLNDRNIWQLAKRALQQDQAQGWDLLDNPNRLRIKTIDGLNSYLVGQMPLLSKMGAPSSILNKGDSAYQEAVHLTLKSSELESEVGRLLRLVNGRFHRAESLLMSMLQKRDQWMGSVLRFTGDEARAHLEQALACIVSDELTQHVAYLSHVMPYLSEACELADYAVQNDQPDLAILCGVRQLSNSLEHVEAWRVLANWLLTKDSKGVRKTVNKNNGFVAGKGVAKERKDQFLNVLASLRESTHAPQILESLVALKSLPDPEYTQDQWDDLQGIISLLRVAAAYLKVVFQSLGQADFIEIAQAATQSLGSELNPTDLAQQLDYQIQHLLVDEFQDTSSEQYALLTKLIAGWQEEDGRTLFIVGDPMQSIYRFREAEVGNFLKAWQGRIGSVLLKPIQLHVNFRSSQVVVDWVNRNFKKVLPADNKIEKGAVRYSDSHAFHQTMDKGDNKESDANATVVNTHWGINRSHEDEALEVVALIQQRLEQFVENDGKSIAVLGRTRSSLTGIARLLKQKNIPFRAVDLEALFERQEVQDVLALSRALLHGSDRAAWIALLRSPLVGLSLQDLHVLMGEQPYQSVWQCLQDSDNSTLSNEGAQRIAACLPVLQHSLSRLGSVPFSVLVRETWLQLDGAQTVENALALENVDVFCQTLAEFDGQLLDFEQLESLMDSLYARADSSPKSQCIELMTMHKSKGLEFDTVILPGLGRKPRQDDTPLVAWFQFLASEQGGGKNLEQLVIAPITQKGQSSSLLSQLLKRFESQKQTYELGRLLYVAATRAKQQLHLFGQINVKETQDTEKEFLPTQNSLLDTLWPCVKNDFNRLVQAHQPEEEGGGINDTLETEESLWPNVSRLSLNRVSFSSMVSGVCTHDQAIKTTEEVISPSTSDANKLILKDSKQAYAISPNEALLNTSVGNLVHVVLEHVVAEGIQNWPESQVAQRLLQRKAFYQRWLQTQGITEPELSHALKRVAHSLNNALTHPKIRWALGNSVFTEAATEYPLSSLSETGDIQHHIVDRTFIDNPHGTRWIIDYKTSVCNETIDRKAFLAHQINTYQPQLARYGKLFAQIENRPQKWVLYFTDLNEWVEVEK